MRSPRPNLCWRTWFRPCTIPPYSADPFACGLRPQPLDIFSEREGCAKLHSGRFWGPRRQEQNPTNPNQATRNTPPKNTHKLKFRAWKRDPRNTQGQNGEVRNVVDDCCWVCTYYKHQIRFSIQFVKQDLKRVRLLTSS